MLPPVEIIELARIVGDPQNDLCIQAEGNVSCLDGQALWVKGSGVAMQGVCADGFACCRPEEIWRAVEGTDEFGEDEARSLLNRSKIDSGRANPSTETFMHAWLLAHPGVGFVAHAHPTTLLSIVCHPRAAEWAERRLFPDEIVLLGAASCFVPYVAPGLPLARAIRREALAFNGRHGMLPKTYWLQNHGLIVTGSNVKETSSALLMAVKAARVLLGCLQTGSEPKWLTQEEVYQIFNWPDEHARQKAMWGS